MTDGGNGLPEAMLNLGNPDRDLADEFEALEDQPSFLPSGREVRPNNKEPFYGALSTSELQLLANPIGTLTVHVIYAKSLHFDTMRKLFPDTELLDFYLRIDFREKQYFSQLCVDIAIADRCVVFDHLITFTIDEVAINEGSEFQVIAFNLIAVDEKDPQRHIIIGSAEKPLLNFIRDMIASDILLLTRPSRINTVDGGFQGLRSMGTVLIKTAFAYGRFGYGYSNQIFDDRMTPSDAIKHSLFPRMSTSGNLVPFAEHPALKESTLIPTYTSIWEKLQRHLIRQMYAYPEHRTQFAGQVMRFKPLPLVNGLSTLANSTDIGNPLLRLDNSSLQIDHEDKIIEMAIPWMSPNFEFTEKLSQRKLEELQSKIKSMKGARRVTFLMSKCAPAP